MIIQISYLHVETIRNPMEAKFTGPVVVLREINTLPSQAPFTMELSAFLLVAKMIEAAKADCLK